MDLVLERSLTMKVLFLCICVTTVVVGQEWVGVGRDGRLFGWGWTKKPVVTKEVSISKGMGWVRPSIKGVGIYGGIRLHQKDPGDGWGWGGGWGLRLQQGWGLIKAEEKEEDHGWMKPKEKKKGWGHYESEEKGWGHYHEPKKGWGHYHDDDHHEEDERSLLFSESSEESSPEHYYYLY